MGKIIFLALGSGFFIFEEIKKSAQTVLLVYLLPTTIIVYAFPFHKRTMFMNLGLIGGLIIAAIREPKKLLN